MIVKKLQEADLKVTPQRLAVLEAVHNIKHHPTAEQIFHHIRDQHPNISLATIYKVLDVFVEKEILIRVKTENGSMRYDAKVEKHHHLYCEETDRIEDYVDDELDNIIASHFKKKKIKNFHIQDIKLQIAGKFIK